MATLKFTVNTIASISVLQANHLLDLGGVHNAVLFCLVRSPNSAREPFCRLAKPRLLAPVQSPAYLR